MSTNMTGRLTPASWPNRRSAAGGKQLVGGAALHPTAGRRPAAVHPRSREHSPGPLHGLQIAVPRWSPDGKQIAFIGGLMSDQGATGGDIYLIPASGGASRRT